jgi:hypothetical protein
MKKRKACSQLNQRQKDLAFLLHLFQLNRKSLPLSSIMMMMTKRKTLVSDSSPRHKSHLLSNCLEWVLLPRNKHQIFLEEMMMKMMRIPVSRCQLRLPLSCLPLQYLLRRHQLNLTSSTTMMMKRKTLALT